jgi:HupE / UreJ protein
MRPPDDLVPTSKWAASVLALGLASWLCPATAHAHKPSDSYLSLTLGGGGARSGAGAWDIALRDLDYALTLDADGDGRLTRAEVRARAADIAPYALDRLSLSLSGETCVLRAGAVTLVEHSDGQYARLPLAIDCPAAAGARRAHEARTIPPAELDYRLFFDLDPQHRGLVRVGDRATGDRDGSIVSSSAPLIFDAHSHRRQIPLAPSGSALSALPPMVTAGARHIANGLDHLLFLLALLLPAVMRRLPDGRGFTPVLALRPALRDVACVVTAFTVAHSITLTLAVLGFARMPSRLVEPAIAASVVIAAANNLWPLFGRDRWVVAFALGLLHGFGFSSALADGGFGGAGLATALVGFNFGVELGQLGFVAAFVPLAFAARGTTAYRRFALGGGSLAIGALALVWFVERSFDVRLLTGRFS